MKLGLLYKFLFVCDNIYNIGVSCKKVFPIKYSTKYHALKGI